MTSTSRRLLLAFSAIGLAASTASSYVHYRLLTQPGFTSFCDVNAAVSCSDAYLSQYGSLWGVPVALGGVLYFALALVMVGLGGRSSATAVRENVPAYVFALSTIALALVLYLAWASFFVLGAFCILCVITYAAVIANFIVSGRSTSFPMTSLPGRARRDVRMLLSNPVPLVIALLFAVGAVSVIAAFPRETSASRATTVQTLPPVTDDERARLAEWWEMQPVVELPVPADGAKVLVIKFSDYQCPACKVTHDLYRDLLAKHVGSGDVRYVLKHFPLEPECNPAAPGGNHFASCEAAAAVIMAQAKGTGEKMEDWIFSNIGPPPLNPAQVREAARDVGGITDFDAQYPRVIEEVKTDAGLGGLLKVNSTPTFFINNRRLPQTLAPQYFNALIELELKRAQ